MFSLCCSHTLAHRLSSSSPSPLPLPLVSKALLDASSALSAVHSAGYVHLDVKPSNLLLSLSGSLVLADFGCALRVGSKMAEWNEGDSRYISMEALKGCPSDRSDVFSLGLVALECQGALTDVPGEGDGWRALRSGSTPVRGYGDAVGRMTSKEPANRPSAEEVREEVSRALRRAGGKAMDFKEYVDSVEAGAREREARNSRRYGFADGSAGPGAAGGGGGGDRAETPTQGGGMKTPRDAVSEFKFEASLR